MGMDVADQVVDLYRLLVDTKRYLDFEEARDRLGLSDDEMRQVVDLLIEAFESDDLLEAAV